MALTVEEVDQVDLCVAVSLVAAVEIRRGVPSADLGLGVESFEDLLSLLVDRRCS